MGYMFYLFYMDNPFLRQGFAIDSSSGIDLPLARARTTSDAPEAQSPTQ